MWLILKGILFVPFEEKSNGLHVYGWRMHSSDWNTINKRDRFRSYEMYWYYEESKDEVPSARYFEVEVPEVDPDVGGIGPLGNPLSKLLGAEGYIQIVIALIALYLIVRLKGK